MTCLEVPEELCGANNANVKRSGFWNAKDLNACPGLRVVFPLEGPGSHRGGNPRKMGKNYKLPLPGPTPENGENCPKKGVTLLRKYNSCSFSVILPFRGFPPRWLERPTKPSVLRGLFRKVRTNFCLFLCDMSQQPSRNCSDKLVQVKVFILGGFWGVDCPPLI